MLYIEPQSTDAAFHFAAEEYCLERFPRDEPVLMLWQTDKCAMLGSCQTADAEIDLSLAERLGIQVVRRSSGGGTIFTDPGTLLYTVILPYHDGDDVKQLERDLVAGPVIRALNEMGVPAMLEGRNDITVEGKKVSGLAQYISKGRLCTHGSLLYDADLETLAQVLRPDEEKIKSKGLRSMRARVTNIIKYLGKPLTTREFWDELKQKLFKVGNIQEYSLTGADIAEIQKISEKKYASPDWLFGRTPRFSFRNHRRFPLGKVEVFLEVNKGMIDSCRIQGDFLGLTPVRGLEEQLETKPYQFPVIEDILAHMDLLPYLGGITREQLLYCIFNRTERDAE